MIIAALMLFITTYQANPQFQMKNVPGSYIEIVRTDYNATRNETSAIFQRYDIVAQNANPNWKLMMPRYYPGAANEQEILKSIVHDNYVKVVGLN